MTEEQAKTKWCPQARVTGLDGPSGNRHVLHADGLNGADRCIASACMAWRQREPITREVQTDLGQLPPGWHENEASWSQIPRLRGDEGLRWRQVISTATGYCGLAGQPS